MMLQGQQDFYNAAGAAGLLKALQGQQGRVLSAAGAAGLSCILLQGQQELNMRAGALKVKGRCPWRLEDGPGEAMHCEDGTRTQGMLLLCFW